MRGESRGLRDTLKPAEGIMLIYFASLRAIFRIFRRSASTVDSLPASLSHTFPFFYMSALCQGQAGLLTMRKNARKLPKCMKGMGAASHAASCRPRHPSRRPPPPQCGPFTAPRIAKGSSANAQPARRASVDVRVGNNCLHTHLGRPSQVRGVRARAMERCGGQPGIGQLAQGGGAFGEQG